MNKKDLVLMIIPILINGIVIFWVQSGISQKILRLEKAENRQDKVLYKFYQLLTKTKFDYIKLKSVEDFIENQASLHRDIEALQEYYVLKNFMLKKFTANVQEIEKTFNCYVAILKATHDLEAEANIDSIADELLENMDRFENSLNKLIDLLEKDM